MRPARLKNPATLLAPVQGASWSESRSSYKLLCCLFLVAAIAKALEKQLCQFCETPRTLLYTCDGNRIPTVEVQHLKINMWIPTFGYQQLNTNSWGPTFEYQHLSTNIWAPTYENQNLTTHIRIPTHEYQHLITNSWIPTDRSGFSTEFWPWPGLL